MDGTQLRCGVEGAEWDEHTQGSLVGQGWGSATQTPHGEGKAFVFVSALCSQAAHIRET